MRKRQPQGWRLIVLFFVGNYDFSALAADKSFRPLRLKCCLIGRRGERNSTMLQNLGFCIQTGGFLTVGLEKVGSTASPCTSFHFSAAPRADFFFNHHEKLFTPGYGYVQKSGKIQYAISEEFHGIYPS